jgi:hypothetical protein
MAATGAKSIALMDQIVAQPLTLSSIPDRALIAHQFIDDNNDETVLAVYLPPAKRMPEDADLDNGRALLAARRRVVSRAADAVAACDVVERKSVRRRVPLAEHRLHAGFTAPSRGLSAPPRSRRRKPRRLRTLAMRRSSLAMTTTDLQARLARPGVYLWTSK